MNGYGKMGQALTSQSEAWPPKCLLRHDQRPPPLLWRAVHRRRKRECVRVWRDLTGARGRARMPPDRRLGQSTEERERRRRSTVSKLQTCPAHGDTACRCVVQAGYYGTMAGPCLSERVRAVSARAGKPCQRLHARALVAMRYSSRGAAGVEAPCLFCLAACVGEMEWQVGVGTRPWPLVSSRALMQPLLSPSAATRIHGYRLACRIRRCRRYTRTAARARFGPPLQADGCLRASASLAP